MFYLLLAVCIIFRGALRAPKSELRGTGFLRNFASILEFPADFIFAMNYFPIFSEKTQFFKRNVLFFLKKVELL